MHEADARSRRVTALLHGVLVMLAAAAWALLGWLASHRSDAPTVLARYSPLLCRAAVGGARARAGGVGATGAARAGAARVPPGRVAASGDGSGCTACRRRDRGALARPARHLVLRGDASLSGRAAGRRRARVPPPAELERARPGRDDQHQRGRHARLAAGFRQASRRAAHSHARRLGGARLGRRGS